MTFTDPALSFASFQSRLAAGPEYDLHISRHSGANNQGDPHAVVFLHGLGASSWSWHDVVDATPDGHESICIDLLGHGQSPKPRHRAYSVYDHARHVVHSVEALGLSNISLVGNSLGGGCALMAATLLAQRQSVHVARIVSLEGIGVRQFTPLAFHLVRVPMLPELFRHLMPATISTRAALRTCYVDPGRITDEQINAYAAPAEDPAHTIAVINSARYVKPDDVDDLPQRYKAITSPTLLIWGQRGNIVPRQVAQTLLDVLPNSTLTMVDDCGHIPHEERPEIVVPMLWNFLQGLSD